MQPIRAVTTQWLAVGCLMLFAVLCSSLCQAQWNTDFSGFATLAAGKTSKPELTFFGYDDEWRADSDSVVGLQWLLSPRERWQLTAQVVARGFSYNHDRHFKPELEWLFLSYQWQPGVRWRVGRLRVPHYLFSESLEVRHSYAWTRPPVDVYAAFLTAFTHFDGADITWSGLWGEAEWEVQAFTGTLDGRFLSNTIDVHAMLGTNVLWRQQDWLFRYSVHLDRTTISNSLALPLEAAWREFSPLDSQFALIADGFGVEKQWFQYHGLALQWEPGNWTAIAELFFSRGPSEGFSTDVSGWYLSLQHRWHRLTPYVVVGAYRSRIAERLVEGLASVDPGQYGLPEQQAAQLAFLKAAGLQVVTAYNAGEETITTGLRWDLTRQVALKAEAQYFEFTAKTTGNMIPVDITRKPATGAIYTFAVDVVF